MTRALFIVAALVVACASAIGLGELVWRRATSRRLDALDDAMRHRSGRTSRPFRHDDLAGLPAPVARYLAFALPEGQLRVRAARVRWTGEMRLTPTGPRSSFTADQRFTTDPPGFLWDARFRMMPVIPVLVRDSYVAGGGQMLGRLGGLANVVDEGGTAEMAQSALTRWLGEAAWLPTAFLPGDGVTWDAIDDSTARATVTDGAVRVSGDFHFAQTGELAGMSAMRYRDVNGRAELTPFEGRYHQFERRDGLMIPSSAEVAWLLPEGRYEYWRGQIVDVHYDLARRP
jgi:hypothetical protein